MTAVFPLLVIGISIDTTIIRKPNLIGMGVGGEVVLIDVQIAVLYIQPRHACIIGPLHANATRVYPIYHHRVGLQAEVVPCLPSFPIARSAPAHDIGGVTHFFKIHSGIGRFVKCAVLIGSR